MKSNHQWEFFRAGGFDQVKLQNGADLMALDQLDQKLWVALACPTTGLEFDTKTLALLDTDKDGRIRVPEIIAAAKWAGSNLKNPDDLLKGSVTLPLSAINDATPEGKQLLSSARQILDNLGKKDVTAISAEDTADTVKIFAQTNFNGDGIIHAEVTDDATLRAVITDIMTCLTAETDRSGKPGVNQIKVDLFFTDAAAYSAWWKVAETSPAILPLGEPTLKAMAAVKAVRAKVDDYFTRCRLAAFDARALTAANREEKDYLVLTSKDLSKTGTELLGFPLAKIEAGQPLPLGLGLNPAWIDAIATFKTDAVTPLLGERVSLTEADWAQLTAKLAAHEAWEAAKAGASVEKLGVKRVREIMLPAHQAAITALIVKDKALEPEANAIASVDRLVHYHRDLFKLLKNFVSFYDFYSRQDKAIFQAGVLYMDQRSCDLCIRVIDAAKHATIAGLAGTYLAYCDCVRKATNETRQILAVFSDGDSDNLMVGRNGIFYDRDGRDWDATITKIIENPISLRQAFWAPYKKLVRVIEEHAAKRAAAADADINTQLATQATTAPAAGQPPAKPKIDIGMLAGVGLALSTLMTGLGLIVSSIFKLPWWQRPLVCLGFILAISLPSMIIAWLKLQKRNLGPLLDGNGWAVNARAKINVPFGRSLTQIANLPEGSKRNLVDPFSDKPPIRPGFLVAVAIVLYLGAIYYFEFVRNAPPAPAPATVKAVSAATNAVPPAK